MRINPKLYIQLSLILVSCLLCSSCTFLRPTASHYALPPGGLLKDRPSPTQASKTAEKEKSDLQAGEAQGKNDLLKKLEVREHDMNQRLKRFSTGAVSPVPGTEIITSKVRLRVGSWLP